MTFDGFAIGACLAFVVHSNLFTRAKLYSANPGLFYLAFIGLTIDLLFRKQADSEPSIGAATAAYHYWYFTTIGIVSLILISHLYHAPQSLAGRLFGWFPVVWLGKLSYSLYLWHVPIQVYVSRAGFPAGASGRSLRWNKPSPSPLPLARTAWSKCRPAVSAKAS